MIWSPWNTLPTPAVSALHLFPIKSCKGTKVLEWEYGEAGLEYDRQWMIADAATHGFLTARTIPRMLLIEPTLDLEARTLTIYIPSYKGLPASTHTIPIDPLPTAETSSDYAIWSSPAQEGFEVGTPELLAALSHFMEREVILVKNGRDRRPAGPPVEGWTSLALEKAGTVPLYRDVPTVGFADAFPILLVTDASRHDIEEHIRTDETVRSKRGFDADRWKNRGAKDFEVERFRGNIVVSGTRPWEEDGWSEIRIGDDEPMAVALRCARCILPNVDPETGIRDKVVPDLVMRPYREGQWSMQPLKTYFGVNLVPMKTHGKIKVGDPVTIVRQFQKNPSKENEYIRPEDTDDELRTQLAPIM